MQDISQEENVKSQSWLVDYVVLLRRKLLYLRIYLQPEHFTDVSSLAKSNALHPYPLYPK
jgi:hypothetical protein